MDKASQVMVTGANGHVGFNLAKTLHEQGYAVRASVRDSSDASKTSALRAAGLTDIVSLNIRDGETFERVSTGVDVLFHVAATYRHHTGSAAADEELIRDSTDGVRAAMTAAARNGIGKVILTSSAVTLPLARPGQPLPDESQWDPAPALAYRRAKIAGEKLAWDMAGTLGIPLAAILPCGILGPDFGRGTQSVDFVLAILKGSMRFGTVDKTFAFIDVRDVVSAHILAATQNATGRFIISPTAPVTMSEALEVMRRIDPRVPRPMMTIPPLAYGALPFFDWAMNRTMGVPRTLTRDFIAGFRQGDMLSDNRRARDVLGWSDRIPLETMLRDTMAEVRRQM